MLLGPRRWDEKVDLLIHWDCTVECVYRLGTRQELIPLKTGGKGSERPAVHRPVGDPVQMYADRFSGHYDVSDARTVRRLLL